MRRFTLHSFELFPSRLPFLAALDSSLARESFKFSDPLLTLRFKLTALDVERLGAASSSGARLLRASPIGTLALEDSPFGTLALEASPAGA